MYLSQSTGKLLVGKLKTFMGAKQAICLSANDAFLNFLVLRGIREGRTIAIIHSLLLQLLEQDCGGLIFDDKGFFHESVYHFAAMNFFYGKKWQEIEKK